ncbi:ABC transporter permease [Mumia quercus]|uniref:ABC transporter permease n=1 Tax=Mumia quercus TaxID=2976125 RepID=UPI0021CE18B6|nr:ABC transporter permease [Mumia quercus]
MSDVRLAPAATGPPTATSARPRSGRLRSRADVRLRRVRLMTPVVLLGAWEVLARVGVLSPDKLPPPSEVLAAGWRLTQDGSLPAHVYESLTRAVVGLAIGGGLALVLGAFAGLLRVGDALVDPTVQMARMLPHLGLVPLLIIWLGIGEPLKITLVALGAFFPIYLNLYAGIRNIDERLVEAARTCGLSALERVRHVVVPGAMPSLFLGVRLAFAAGWLSLVVGEQVNTDSGLGFMMMEAREFSQTEIVLLGLLSYAVLGLLSDIALRAAERRALSWRRGLQAS